jgi:hypothetical protein
VTPVDATTLTDAIRNRHPPLIDGRKCNECPVAFRYVCTHLGRALVVAAKVSLTEDGVDSLVADVFFVVEGSDVGRDECFDAVPESSGRFSEGHPSA